MKGYPVQLNVSGKRAVIAGGGTVAARKARDLVKCGAYVTVISPEFSDELKKIHDENRDSITLLEREYMEGDLESSFLAFGATDSSEVNEAVRAEAEKKGILSNIADNPDGSLFIVNSSKSIGDLSWSISTNGKSPAMAARLNREFQKNLPVNIEAVLDRLGLCREILKSESEFSDLDSERRGEILRKLAESDEMLEILAARHGRQEIVSFLKKLL